MHFKKTLKVYMQFQIFILFINFTDIFAQVLDEELHLQEAKIIYIPAEDIIKVNITWSRSWIFGPNDTNLFSTVTKLTDDEQYTILLSPLNDVMSFDEDLSNYCKRAHSYETYWRRNDHYPMFNASGKDSLNRENETYWLLIPENKSHDFVLIPECTYEIKIMPDHVVPNAKSITKRKLLKNITIPECVDQKCSCRWSEKVPRPYLNATQNEHAHLVVKWVEFIEDTATNFSKWSEFINITKLHIKFGENREHHTFHDIMYEKNISTEMLLSNEIFEEILEDVYVKNFMDYVITIYFIDSRNCKTPQRAVYYTGQPPKISVVPTVLSNEELKKGNWLNWLIVSVVLTFVGVSICYWKRLYLARLLAPPTLEHAHWWQKCLGCIKTTRHFNVPMERNILYINKNNIQTQENPEESLLLSISEDIYEIPYSLLKMQIEIGRGAFGCVYKATISSDLQDITVAVKILREEPKLDDLNEFEHEIEMMKACGRHDNVVKFLGICRQPKMCIIMEYISCGDLLTYLRSLRDIYLEKKQFNIGRSSASYITPNGLENMFETPPLTPMTVCTTRSSSSATSQSTNLERILDANELLEFAIQISRGMRHLEERNVIHRDLAARNVLINQDRILKISDFGMSRQMEVYVVNANNTNSGTRKVPLRWMPPEAITSGKYSSSSDVWSFGVVLWELGTLGAFPYANVPNESVLSYIFSCGRLQVPPNCSPKLRELILKCWQLDPAQRPPFCQIVIELENMRLQNSEHSAYVNFEHVNPYYMLPPTQQ